MVDTGTFQKAIWKGTRALWKLRLGKCWRKLVWNLNCLVNMFLNQPIRLRPELKRLLNFYIGRGIGIVEIQEAEIEDCRYFSFEEALARITYEESKAVLREASVLIDERNKRRYDNK